MGSCPRLPEGGLIMDYNERLISSAEKAGNVVCMGLDPVVQVLPYDDLDDYSRICRYAETLFSAVSGAGLCPAAFKPNIGYYSVLDRPREGRFDGSRALAAVLDMLSSFFPGIPVILDSKRGDIAKSSLNYANEAFCCWNADSVTVSPYMGTDSIGPFAFPGKGMYILNRTSNPGGADLQNRLMLDSVDEKEQYPLYMAVAHTIARWADGNPGYGAVVGATNLKELEDIASYFAGKGISMLIPGVGSQGGSAPEVMDALRRSDYDVRLARINSSSGLTHPWKKAPAPADWTKACLNGLEKLISEASL